MQENILTWFITAAGGGLTWFVYTLSNRVTAIETREKQQKENDDKAYREHIIDGQKIDQILSELSELKQIINVHINQDKIEKEHLRGDIAEMKREIEELIRQKSNVR